MNYEYSEIKIPQGNDDLWQMLPLNLQNQPVSVIKTNNEMLAKQTFPHHIFNRADELVVEE